MDEATDNMPELLIEDLDKHFYLLVERYAKKIQSYCKKILPDEHLCEEATQQTFMNAYISLKQKVANEAGHKWLRSRLLGPWLFIVARNVCYKQYNARKGENLFDPLDSKNAELVSINDPMASVDAAIDLVKVMSRLPQPWQDVLYLRYREDLTLKEISEKLGKPLNTIKSIDRRAKEKLANYLKAISSEE